MLLYSALDEGLRGQFCELKWNGIRFGARKMCNEREKLKGVNCGIIIHTPTC